MVVDGALKLQDFISKKEEIPVCLNAAIIHQESWK